MSMDFAVGLNRLTGFPLDPKSYFEAMKLL